MPLMVSEQEEHQREIMAAGQKNFICAFVEDLGFQKNFFEPNKPAKRQVVLCFEMEEKMTDGRPFMLSRKYTASLYKEKGKSSNLRRDLSQWRGRDFNEQEAKAFDLLTLWGVRGQMIVTVEEGKNKIALFLPPTQGQTLPAAITNKDAPKWVSEEREKQVPDPALTKTNAPPPDPSDDLPF